MSLATRSAAHSPTRSGAIPSTAWSACVILSVCAGAEMRTRHKQGGVVLLIGLIMLVLLTLMAVAALRFGTSNFMVVNNQQTRAETIRSAEQVIDQILVNPGIAMSASDNLFGTGNNTLGIDINGDGVNDYSVFVAKPVCVKRPVIPNATLQIGLEEDDPCIRGVAQAELGVEGAGASDSLCSEITWDVTAKASDAFFQNTVTVVQGIGQRKATTKVSTVCD